MSQPIRRHAPLALTLLACALLAVAEFTTLYSVHVGGVTVHTGTVGGHHGFALLLLALAAAVMAVGAARGGSLPAAFALLGLAAAALAIALAVDLPAVGRTGLYGRNYENARAQSEIGFKLETLGAFLLLLGAVATLMFTPRRAGARTREGDAVRTA
jgi:hypothetical protein